MKPTTKQPVLFIKKTILVFVTFAFICFSSCEKKSPTFDLPLAFETSQGTETNTYKECINFYKKLAQYSNKVQLRTIGRSDSGEPLHLIIYNEDEKFNLTEIRKHSRIVLINNGIHPGESDGIDASMMLLRDLVNKKIESPKNVVLAIIPIYNIGGALNRNSHTRTNQNGPKVYGFRGNAQNYDLNRDFIKCDTKNAKSFAAIYHTVNPDVFVDTHVSNGADYQYTLTHLMTQKDKLGGVLGDFLQNKLQSQIETHLKQKKLNITPYVNVYNRPPNKGFSQFMDYPRYSSGYTTLFHSLGLMIETHMLKPYKQRVESTYQMLHSILISTSILAQEIKKLKTEQDKYYQTVTHYPISWKLDSTQFQILPFKGYRHEYISSKITGQKRLKFQNDSPVNLEIPYYNTFIPNQEVKIPKGYIIPRGWHQIIELLRLNKIKMKPIQQDTLIEVESYKIKDYLTYTNPYEGHYLHYNTQVESKTESVLIQKGDFYISTRQKGMRYLLETLEPQANDSFFNWNFFDTILQQKEGFSAYVWEDKAWEVLQNNPKLNQEFQRIKRDSMAFNKSAYQQLSWLHKNSLHYEKNHLKYPLFRVLK